MNIDELKNAWNGDLSEETPDISMEQQNKINLPLEKIRKNMRMEFWSTVSVFIFAFAVIWIPVPWVPFRFKFYLTVLIASMVVVTFFFFSNFFNLYKNISNPAMKTYDGLKDLLHQLELNRQYYLSFYLSFVPFLVCELIIVIEFLPHYQPVSDLQVALTILSMLTVGLFGLFLVAKYWYRIFYGKYIAKIENLLEEFLQ